MEYKNLGPTGLKVSSLGFGFRDPALEDQYFSLLKSSYESGVNYFDTAEFYGYCNSQPIFGNCIKRLDVPRESRKSRDFNKAFL
jgi:aryl-alcohol dehydrogenase-like predicted oxidoreductase